MLLPTISIVYDRRHRRELEVSVYHNGKRRYFSTGVHLPKGARYSNGVVNGCLDAPEINNQLSGLVKELRQQVAEMGENADISALNVSGRQGKSFADWAETYIEHTYKDSPQNYAEQHRRMLGALLRCGFIDSSGFTERNAKRFKKWVDSQGWRQSTMWTMWHCATRLVSAAVRDGFAKADPFTRLSVKHGRSREIAFLSLDEVGRIESLKLRPGTKLCMARDMFLFACYTGMAHVDIYRTKLSDVQEVGGFRCLIKRRKKTGQPYLVRLSAKAMAILERYGSLDLMRADTARYYLAPTVKNILTVANLAGITKQMTMHVGRHTFATLALSEGIPIEVVSKMLAHSSVRTTEVYAKVIPQRVLDAYKVLEDRLK